MEGKGFDIFDILETPAKKLGLDDHKAAKVAEVSFISL